MCFIIQFAMETSNNYLTENANILIVFTCLDITMASIPKIIFVKMNAKFLISTTLKVEVELVWL